MPTDNNILVRDDKHDGKYVAFKSVADRTIVAEGDDPEVVVRQAKDAGFEHPMILYVPDKNMTCCY